ncbi:MAG: hypothetical protein DMG65_04835 [Candidatus Angelobacter sp. Gp1-AA117]|nr:MAG: hypothetical protein DMG65_04835 [Candidatus Angelobacter sp. Gp1-AA117]
MKRLLTILFAVMLLTAISASAQTFTGCFAHHPKYIEGKFEVSYSPGCTGHDEPELDPVSSAPGSARDLTWTVVLPTGGSARVSDVGPTFWFGGAVTDPKSVFGQAFVELQFYPDSVVGKCFNDGAFSVSFSPNTFTACSPVFKLNQTGNPSKFLETTAFNAMLEDSANPGNPLIMHAGETITIHYYVTPANDGFHITVTDLNTGHSGTIILNSSSEGPLMPVFDTQQTGNALAWGTVNDTPNSFVWEIGHASIFTGGDAFCVPGQTNCNSYDPASWAGFSPIQIKSVTFGDGSSPKNFAAVSDLGGKAEVAQTCATYGGSFCIYPWFTLGTSGFHYGVDYPDTRKDFGQANQFATTEQCGGPSGANTTFCSTILK